MMNWINCAANKLRILFRVPRKEKKIITLDGGDYSKKFYCPVNEFHTFRGENGKSSYTYYCTQCARHYIRKELISK